MSKRVYFFPRYNTYAASSRLRIYALFKNLAINGYSNEIYPFFFFNRFQKKGVGGWIIFIISILYSVIKRIKQISSLKKGDIVFVQYEILPFLSPWLELKVKKKGAYLILDFDDAFYLSYESSRFNCLRNKYKEILSEADLVITGSPLLTKYISVYNDNVIEIPTVVQDLYHERSANSTYRDFVIGWIGSPTTSKYIDQIAPIIYKFLNANTGAQFLLIGYSGQGFSNSSSVQMIEWSEENERNMLPCIDVGIMPLSDDEWTNGKCGFKLIQYMAAGKPTISTPLHANKKIDGGIGNLFATSSTEWLDALEYFHDHKDIAQAIGAKNRIRAEEQYIFSAVLPRYNHAFNKLFNSISAN